MNILYIHQYFHTPQEPGGTRSYWWISQELIKRGHIVTMITGSSTIKEKRVAKTIDGINVVYLKEAYSQSMSIRTNQTSLLKK